MIFEKDPSAVLDYVLDWSEWFRVNRLHIPVFTAGIASATVTPDAGLTVDSFDVHHSIVRVWLSGGTAGTTYNVSCHIVTNAGREDSRRLVIDVLNDPQTCNERVFVVGRQDLAANPQNDVGRQYWH